MITLTDRQAQALLLVDAREAVEELTLTDMWAKYLARRYPQPLNDLANQFDLVMRIYAMRDGTPVYWLTETGEPAAAEISADLSAEYPYEVAAAINAFEYELCESCERDLDEHLIGPDSLGHAHVYCLAGE